LELLWGLHRLVYHVEGTAENFFLSEL